MKITQFEIEKILDPFWAIQEKISKILKKNCITYNPFSNVILNS